LLNNATNSIIAEIATKAYIIWPTIAIPKLIISTRFIPKINKPQFRPPTIKRTLAIKSKFLSIISPLDEYMQFEFINSSIFLYKRIKLTKY